jgi:hypothetical protein
LFEQKILIAPRGYYTQRSGRVFGADGVDAHAANDLPGSWRNNRPV